MTPDGTHWPECETLQVDDAVGLSTLIHKIQDERAAVALNIFLDRPPTDQMADLQMLVDKDVDLGRFILSNVSLNTSGGFYK